MVTALQESLTTHPLQTLIEADQPGVLAIITEIDGPAYRPLGATMAVTIDGMRAGSLSSGCVEDDIGLHAIAALEARETRKIKYGRGSPFVDIQLPCGGGMEITLVPNPDLDALQEVLTRHARRQPCSLKLTEAFEIEVVDLVETGHRDGTSSS